MSRAVEWREAVEKAKTLEQRFELSDGHSFEIQQPGVKLREPNGDYIGIHVPDEELVRLGHWLYETFFDAEGVE